MLFNDRRVALVETVVMSIESIKDKSSRRSLDAGNNPQILSHNRSSCVDGHTESEVHGGISDNEHVEVYQEKKRSSNESYKHQSGKENTPSEDKEDILASYFSRKIFDSPIFGNNAKFLDSLFIDSNNANFHSGIMNNRINPINLTQQESGENSIKKTDIERISSEDRDRKSVV